MSAESDGQSSLAFLLDAPMQSWASASRFQRRGTNHHPTKSGLAGMIAAAMGLPKGSELEGRTLARLSACRLITMALPRRNRSGAHPVTRLRDYHTVGGGYDKKVHPLSIPRKAKGGPGDNATVTEREYLTDVRFGVVLTEAGATDGFLESVRAALLNPVWGVWLGRKCCVPAQPFGPELFANPDAGLTRLIERAGFVGCLPQAFDRETECGVGEMDLADATFDDQPVSFGSGRSSGTEGRVYGLRGVRLERGRKS
jgi:CRISPR system Cascade subunit CasD